MNYGLILKAKGITCLSWILRLQIVELFRLPLVRFGKNIVGSITNKFRTELYSLIQTPCGDLILDLFEVNKIDSVGIALIITAHSSLLKNGYNLRIINLKKDILDLFSAMRIDRHLIIEKT